MAKTIQIGGEHFYPLSIFFRRDNFNLPKYLAQNYSQRQYLSGGAYFSILAILKTVKFFKNEIVLLPSFLCPSILKPLKKMGIKYKFYKINKKLQIDIVDLKARINENVKAVFYINYFGFPPKQDILAELRNFQQEGILLIEDCAQCLFPTQDNFSDFCFNSFRKFLPLDGSILISKVKLEIDNSLHISQYFLLRHFARFLRFLNTKIPLEFSKIFLTLIIKSDQIYYSSENSSFNKFNRTILAKFSFESIKANRRIFFHEIVNILKDKCIYNTLGDDTIPLGVPIIINARDDVRKQLIDKNIFCPIHWKLSKEIDKKEFAESWELSEQILTIPIRENFSKIEMQYLINNLKEIT
jgi:hypothetical protein